MAKKSRKYAEAAKLIDRTQRYALNEAVELAKKTSITKFDGTVEVAFNLNLDPRKAEQNLRGAIVLPYGSGKSRTVLVLTKSAEKIKEAEAAGADFVGDAEYLEKIKGGWFGFDIIVATPDMMGELGKLLICLFLSRFIIPCEIRKKFCQLFITHGADSVCVRYKISK